MTVLNALTLKLSLLISALISCVFKYFRMGDRFFRSPFFIKIKTKSRLLGLHFVTNSNIISCFQGRVFYLTPSIFPSWKKLKVVIEAAGGSVDNKRRRNVEQIREVNKADRDPVYLIITCEHDLHIVTDILKAKIGIFNTEFVMSAVMRGKMDFDLTKSITTI